MPCSGFGFRGAAERRRVLKRFGGAARGRRSSAFVQERNSRQRTGGGIQYARGSTDEQGIPADGRGTHVAVTMRFRATSSRGQGKTRGEDRTAFEIEEAGEQKDAAQLTTGSGSGCMCASLRAHRTRCSPQTQTEATTGGDGEAVAVAHGGR